MTFGITFIVSDITSKRVVADITGKLAVMRSMQMDFKGSVIFDIATGNTDIMEITVQTNMQGVKTTMNSKVIIEK
tara:strand:+ start:202 stop:426 length:225 start_codon:yes stop_codon:yes gene_type:complete